MRRRFASIPCLLLLLISLMGLLVVNIGPTAAATFTPGCDVAALQSAVATINSNNQDDTLDLASGCTYTVTSSVTVDSDSGHTLTLHGHGAIISGTLRKTYSSESVPILRSPT